MYIESIREILMPALDSNRVRMPITANDEFLFRVSIDEGRRIAFRKEMRQYRKREIEKKIAADV